MPTLDQVESGARCRIESLAGAPALIQRLLELGLMEGERVRSRGGRVTDVWAGGRR